MVLFHLAYTLWRPDHAYFVTANARTSIVDIDRRPTASPFMDRRKHTHLRSCQQHFRVELESQSSKDDHDRCKPSSYSSLQLRPLTADIFITHRTVTSQQQHRTRGHGAHSPYHARQERLRDHHASGRRIPKFVPSSAMNTSSTTESLTLTSMLGQPS